MTPSSLFYYFSLLLFYSLPKPFSLFPFILFVSLSILLLVLRFGKRARVFAGYVGAWFVHLRVWILGLLPGVIALVYYFVNSFLVYLSFSPHTLFRFFPNCKFVFGLPFFFSSYPISFCPNCKFVFGLPRFFSSYPISFLP